jgi:hypothetical protein
MTTTSVSLNTYDNTVKAAMSIQVGQSMDDVQKVLGDPILKNASSWKYDFSKLSGIPGIAPGVQIFYGVTIDFDETKKVSDKNFSWADAE